MRISTATYHTPARTSIEFFLPSSVRICDLDFGVGGGLFLSYSDNGTWVEISVIISTFIVAFFCF